MGIRDVLDLMPHLRDLERMDFADLLVVPLRTPLSQTYAFEVVFDVEPGSTSNGRSVERWEPWIFRYVEVGIVLRHELDVDNRRLVVLKCFQACRQDETVWAPCQINRSKNRFWDHFDTTVDGLSIVPRLASEESLHLGGPIFNPARQGMHAVKRFSEKHSAMGKSFLHMVKIAASQRRQDADTITMASASVVEQGDDAVSSARPRKRQSGEPEAEHTSDRSALPYVIRTRQWMHMNFQWGRTPIMSASMGRASLAMRSPAFLEVSSDLL